MADKKSAAKNKFTAEESSPGTRLKIVREKQNKTLQSASEEMRLDRWMLEAIERDDFAALGAPVFAKGHLRQYAKLLGVDADDLMVGYYQVCGSREQPPLLAESVLRTEGRNDKNFSWVWPTLLVLLLISAIGVGIYLWMQPAEQPASVSVQADSLTLGMSATADPLPSDSATAAPVTAPAPVIAGGEPDPGITDSLLIPASAAPQVEPTPSAEGAGSIASQNITVTLRFSKESWVEVYDGNRQKLLFGLVDLASVKYLSGPPPLSVFLGQQSAVKVEVNGTPYAIPGDALRGNTARFSIERPR